MQHFQRRHALLVRQVEHAQHQIERRTLLRRRALLQQTQQCMSLTATHLVYDDGDLEVLNTKIYTVVQVPRSALEVLRSTCHNMKRSRSN